MSDIVIFGTGSFGELAHFYFTQDSGHRVVAFTGTRDSIRNETFLDLPVVPFEEIEQHYPSGRFGMFIAVGYTKMNQVRAAFYDQAKAKGYQLVSYVSSRCTNWADTPVGDNCFIFEDNTIQPFVTIGNDVVLWSGNHIGHHSVIQDHVFVTSHVVVSGYGQIGAYSFLGVNATIRDEVSVGKSCLVGAGSLIMKSTADHSVYIPKRTDPSTLRSDQLPI
jgi:sugar O-acyltransferase (sialic acid O-acetyltransferase NeuD family)